MLDIFGGIKKSQKKKKKKKKKEKIRYCGRYQTNRCRTG